MRRNVTFRSIRCVVSGRRLKSQRCNLSPEGETEGTMQLDIAQVIAIVANLGVLFGIVFLALEIRQNNRHLAAQARYSLRQYRSDIVDSMLLPHVVKATQKWVRGETLTDEERSTGLMVALKAIELWEWQYGEYAAGMLRKSELPVGAWRQVFHGKAPFHMPMQDVYAWRKDVLNADFVRYFEENVVAQPIE